ncbi:MAG: tetratricopeptide repeat protein [Rhodocyclaceae bacterium]|nr:tetratricopeptide repeat protein [Rhodocyclaceae bacterium]
MNHEQTSSPHSMDVAAGDFEDKVMRASFDVPVVVDFWAPWCGPCRTLGPILEKLAAEYGGRFILAKINADENQELAAQLGVRGIPAVKAIVQGQLANEFTGAQPESAVRRFIEALLPSPAEPLYREAVDAIVSGDNALALERLNRTLEADGKFEPALLDRAELFLEMGQAEEARTALAGIGEVEDRTRLDALFARLELAAGASAVQGDEAELAARIEADAGDLAARLELARLLANRRMFEPAMEQLLEIVRRDRKFEDEAGRKTLIALFNLLGGDHELVRRYRSRLATALNV